MATVPTYNSSLTAQALPGVRRSPNAQANSFGGVQAQEQARLGGAIGQMAGAVSDLAGEMQARKDEDEVRSTMNLAMENARQHMAGVYGTQGKAGSEVVKPTEDFFAEQQRTLKGTLRTPNQQRTFEQQFQGLAQSNISGASRHAFRETQRNHELTLDTAMYQTTQTAIANRTEPEAQRQAVADIRRLTAERYEGFGAGEVATLQTQAVEKFHVTMTGALMQESAAKAEKYLKDNKDGFTEKTYTGLMAAVSKQTMEVKASQYAVNLLDKTPAEQQGAIETLAKTNPEAAKSTSYWLDKLSSDREKRAKVARAANIDSVMTGIDEAMAGGKSPDEIIRLISNLSVQTDRAAATEYYRDMSKKGPTAAIPYIMELNNMTEAQLLAADLNKYASKIPAAETAKWREAQADLNGDNGDAKKSASMWDAKQRTMFVDNFGHLKGKDPEQNERYNTAFNNYIRMIKETGANDVAATTKILQDMMKEVTYEEAGWLYGTNTVTNRAAFLNREQRVSAGALAFDTQVEAERKYLADNRPTNLSPNAVPAVNFNLGDGEEHTGYVEPHPRPNTNGLLSYDVFSPEGQFLGRAKQLTWWERKGYSSEPSIGEYATPDAEDFIRFTKNQ